MAALNNNGVSNSKTSSFETVLTVLHATNMKYRTTFIMQYSFEALCTLTKSRFKLSCAYAFVPLLIDVIHENFKKRVSAISQCICILVNYRLLDL